MNRAWRAALIVGLLLWPLLALAEPPANQSPKAGERLREVKEALAKRDFDTAAKRLKAAAGKGDPEADNLFGELYMSGSGVKASALEALKWFEKAADAGFPGAQYNLSRLLSSGAEGVPKDEDKARFLMRSAAEAGFAPAQFAVGQTAEAAEEKIRDYADARAWFEKAAAQEHAGALLALARFHDNGISAERDPVKGTDFCLRAARAGSAVAMNEMGVRYQKGTGLRLDKVAAIGWFTLASQHGLPAALVNLGNCYEVGSGVLQDFDQAGRYYSLAVRQKFAPAEFLLAQMIEQGKGTTANPTNAYVLYARAASRNNEEAGKRAEAIKGKLTAAQIAEAEKLLRDGAAPGISPGQKSSPPNPVK